MTAGAVGAVALTVFLLVASGAVLVAFVRGVRSRGFPDLTRGDGAEAYLRAVAGPQPRTPRPQWADRAATDDDSGRPDSTGS